ncbi:hypothetical protein THRCLA_20263 [Thraustotheca clavata]|uniref:SnoaL-like domain-containing protein n=1 Tax=Thraustotheca clavata TaxID=74557 RepID=A0A1W0A9E4_9STRA|nr:hypothetical protein THRCLA_20263 [Thraustotheca clavata]
MVKNLQEFANVWVASWNSHDLEAILSHYTDDIEMTSPYMVQVVGVGTLQGKEKLREYWRLGLERNPKLEFRVVDVAIGVDMVSIYYYSVTMQKHVIESFWFNENGLVFKCNSAYCA